MIATSEKIAVIGMGMTGFSAVRYLRDQNKIVVVYDTRKTPPQLKQFKIDFPEVAFHLGEIDSNELIDFTRIVVSPGVSIAQPAIANAIEQGINVIGDIQLFIEHIKSPFIAITGSNAKSTVTTLVGEMAKVASIDVDVAGNIGTPVLDLLTEENQKQLYVLELSSFQLETVEKLNASIACCLNVSMDHMDRYDSFASYHAAKQRVYFGAEKIVVNRDDELTKPPIRSDMVVTSFGLGLPDLKTFGVITEDGKEFLAYGFEQLLPVSELKMKGKHNVANALAALAIGHLADFPMKAMVKALRHFRGLAHRCEWIACVNGIDFINDSKGTNVGASLAALNGLARLPNKIILIAGGEGKGADFSSLAQPIKQFVRSVIVIGADAEIIAEVVRGQQVDVQHAVSMKEAVNIGFEKAEHGDVVLLSPACASFDMFQNFGHRGECFIKAVEELAA